MDETIKNLLNICIESTLYAIVIGTISGVLGYFLVKGIVNWKEVVAYFSKKEAEKVHGFTTVFSPDSIEIGPGSVPNTPEARTSVTTLSEIIESDGSGQDSDASDDTADTEE